MAVGVCKYCDEHGVKVGEGTEGLTSHSAVGKGGFAKCYRLVDTETNEEWACKVVQKASLTKQRHKAKVRRPSLCTPTPPPPCPCLLAAFMYGIGGC